MIVVLGAKIPRTKCSERFIDTLERRIILFIDSSWSVDNLKWDTLNV